MKCPIYDIVIYEMSFYEMSQRQIFHLKTIFRDALNSLQANPDLIQRVKEFSKGKPELTKVKGLSAATSISVDMIW